MRLKLYLIIIFVSLFAIFAFHVGFALDNYESIFALAGFVLFGFVVIVILDFIVAGLIRLFPKKWVNPYIKLYKVHKWERKFYEKLGIKKWKDLVPETGQMADFKKNEITDKNDNDYIYKFCEETIYAEVMHFLSAPIGFLILLIFPDITFSIFLPIAIVNAILQLPPALIQRYNRPKLMKLYEYNLKHKKIEA